MSALREATPAARLLHIGAVCRALQEEFSDVSISKIRYLEDQGLLKPKRTKGRYRLFDEDDVERLRTILRLQRDEFLPLRVIRQELAAPGARRPKRRGGALEGPQEEISLQELTDQSGASPALIRELEEFGLLEPRANGREKRYAIGDADIAAACVRLNAFGIDARHLRAFRTAADREAALLEQLLAPALRSRNPERRQAALDDLQELSEAAQELGHALSARALRRVAAQ